MVSRYNNAPTQNGNMLIGSGGDSAISHVDGMQLKQVDVPVETVLGVASGALHGGILGALGSAVVTIGKEGSYDILENTSRNLTKSHLLPVLAVTTAMGVMGGLVRWSRARKHNEWSEQHYQFMAQKYETNQMRQQTSEAPATPERQITAQKNNHSELLEPSPSTGQSR